VLALLVLALEVGFQLSHYPSMEGAAALQGPVLGLMSLLLAFSYAMAADRYTMRRALVVKEANAIGTFYLRTGFLGDPTRSQIRTRLQRYTELHVDAPQVALDVRRFAKLCAEGDALQREIWSRLEAVVPTTDADVVLLNTQALNAVIDVSAERLEALQNRIPESIFFLLVGAVLASGVLVGYGPRARRGWLSWAIFSLLVTFVMFTLFDLDRPGHGLVRTSQEPLLDVQHLIQSQR
jgi:hypothetical protein